MSNKKLPESQTSQETIDVVYEFVNRHDKAHATKFLRLNPDNQRKAIICIKLHLKNCKRADVPFDLCAVKEIITDAHNGIFFMFDNERERKQADYTFHSTAQSSLKAVQEMI